MDMNALRPVREGEPPLPTCSLELAPSGWRHCVEILAEGYAEIVDAQACCLNCGGMLDGAQGHEINCVTMVARRMLANEPLLHERSDSDRERVRASSTPVHGAGVRTPASAVPSGSRSNGIPCSRVLQQGTSYSVPSFLRLTKPLPIS